MIPVLFVLADLAGGGAERVTVELLRGLDRRTCRPMLALFERTGSFVDFIPTDVPVYLFDGPHLLKRQGLRRLAAQLREIVAESRARLLVPGTILPVTALFRASFLWRGMPAIVSTQHDNLSQETAHRARGWKRRLLLAELRLLYTRAARVACVSTGVQRDLTRRFSVPARKCRVILNGLDLETIRQRAGEPVEESWFPPREGPTILTAGRLVTQKAQHDLLDAFRVVRDRMPARLVIIGEGPLEGELRRRADALRLTADVVFAGFQRNPWKFMARADLFVLSSHHEGMGNVLVEAMACGTPVLSTDCDFGPSELIRDGETGALTPVDQPRALGEAMAGLLEDGATRRRYAENARRRLDFFSSSRMVKDYQALFEETEAARAPSPA